MLVRSEDGNDTFYILGIDPGSTNLGVGIIEACINTGMIISSSAWTIHGDKLMPKDTWVEQIHGTRYVRIRAIGKELLRIFKTINPLYIACESPFINMRRPQAYGVLTEVICAIRAAVIEYDTWRKLELIDPPTIKIAVGAKGNADKDAMKKAIMLLNDLVYAGEIAMADLDEHAVDGLAVAYCLHKKLMELLCLKEKCCSS